MVTPRQVLDLQGDLAERLEDPEGKLAMYLNLVTASNGVGENALRDPQLNVVGRLAFEHILTGRAFRVSASMTHEVERRAWDDASDMLPEEATVADLAPPRHRGFAYFETPVHYTTSDSLRTAVAAMSWGLARTQTGEVGYLISYWGDIDVEIDEVLCASGAASLHEWTPEIHHYVFGRWAPVTGFWAPRHETIGPARYTPSEESINRIRGLGFEPNMDTPASGRAVIALWQLLCETVDTEHHHVEKVTPARLRVDHLRTQVRPEVNLVTLRRPARPNLHPGTGKKRTTRSWVEGGYTQTFWTGPGRQVPVTRTIGGHWSVKDEELPIKNRPTVYDLRR